MDRRIVMIEPVLSSPWVYYTTKPDTDDWYETQDSGGEKQKLYYHDGRWYINESCTEKHPYHIAYWKDNYTDRLTPQKTILFTYETKCRKCGDITDWYFSSSDDMKWFDFAKAMIDHVQYPRLYRCSKCDMQTVQDVVSYTDFTPINNETN